MASKHGLRVTGITIALVWAMWWLIAPDPFANVAAHWEVAFTMMFGSLIAGATCEGGGAVAFPVFTKVLQVSPTDARWFALAIQSVGMSAATLTIFAMRRKVDLGAILRIGVGGAIGIAVGSMVLAPHVQPAVVRVLFTTMQCGFALTLLVAFWRSQSSDSTIRAEATPRTRQATWILVFVGMVGGMVSSLFGHGLDLTAFSVLVLLFRVDERIATPTTVVLMASNSLVGLAIGAWSQQYSAVVWQYWQAAIPIVVVGAPLGAFLCTWLSRGAIVAILVTLIAIEFITTLWLIPMTPQLAALGLVALAVCWTSYWSMSRCRWFWPEANGSVCSQTSKEANSPLPIH